VPLSTETVGEPEMVGARFAALTAIEKGARFEESWPSLTVIVMAANVPTFAAAGVPCSRPVVVLNEAQDGLLAMLNVSVVLSASLAVGVKVYAVPTVAVAAGVPEIDGAVFAEATAIENAGNAADALPSRTLITMLP
jgi:hypothetical protein